MIDQLNELNRVLSVAKALTGAGPEYMIPIDSVVRVCKDSVLGGRMPDHILTIQFAVEVGLLECQGEEVRLAGEGLDFLSLNPRGFFELTDEQRRVLRRKQYLGGVFARPCREIFGAFAWSDDPPRLTWSELDDAALSASPWLLEHLCQLGLLRRTETGFESTEEAGQAIAAFIEEPKGLTEEKLRQMLLEKEAVGDIGEELALSYERGRLMAAGRVVEAHCVRRISRLRVNAGYDVESFNDAAPSGIYDRFIEAKAARGKQLRFFWTENEMKVAEELGERYWIYFFGGVDASSRTTAFRPMTFQDPLRSILQNSDITKSAQGYLVQAKFTGTKA
jgi:hypothetical protein